VVQKLSLSSLSFYLYFGADKIPTIARGLAKGITQVKQATNEIKSEIQKSAEIDPTKANRC
jgi:sec-independent protein translocase protein TatA